jgi:hypothetical protein
MSSFTLLPVVKQESLPLMYPTSWCVELMASQVAGIMMLGIGIWYLGFGTSWIARYRGEDNEQMEKKSGLHLITGIQVLLCTRFRLTVRSDSLRYRWFSLKSPQQPSKIKKASPLETKS